MIIVTKVAGNPNGKYIYSTVIIDEDELSSCECNLYCADNR